MTISEAILKYGPINEGRWANEREWMVVAVLHPEVARVLIKSATNNPTDHIYCNKDMAVPLLAGFDNVRDRGLLGQLRTFDGCFEIRRTRGETGLSSHSWGLAFDINAYWNPLGGPATLSEKLVQCFTDVGLVWGGNFRRTDGMHFSLGW